MELKTNEIIYLHSADYSAMRFFARGCFGADVKVIQKITRKIHRKKMPQVLLDTTYSLRIHNIPTHFSLRMTMRLKLLADGRMLGERQGRVYYYMFSLLISSLGISNWPYQRYWSRLHGALSLQDSLIP